MIKHFVASFIFLLFCHKWLLFLFLVIIQYIVLCFKFSVPSRWWARSHLINNPIRNNNDRFASGWRAGCSLCFSLSGKNTWTEIWTFDTPDSVSARCASLVKLKAFMDWNKHLIFSQSFIINSSRRIFTQTDPCKVRLWVLCLCYDPAIGILIKSGDKHDFLLDGSVCSKDMRLSQILVFPGPVGLRPLNVDKNKHVLNSSFFIYLFVRRQLCSCFLMLELCYVV